MLLDRQEMTYDFGGARLDPVRDHEAIGWMMNQFLYGEVTGIQVGHWLYNAPDIESARFLSRQAIEEFQHVDNFVRIMKMMDIEPAPPHPIVRFLSTGMMGDSWAEHVALEMAAGEGFVLMAFYALIDTLDHEETVAILSRAVKQEERHVEFGEQQTMKAIRGREWLRRRLLGLNLVSMWAVRRLAAFMQSRLPASHEVLSQLPGFLDKTMQCAELRLQRMGVLHGSLDDLPRSAQARLVAEAYGGKAVESSFKLLTSPLRMLPVRQAAPPHRPLPRRPRRASDRPRVPESAELLRGLPAPSACASLRLLRLLPKLVASAPQLRESRVGLAAFDGGAELPGGDGEPTRGSARPPTASSSPRASTHVMRRPMVSRLPSRWALDGDGGPLPTRSVQCPTGDTRKPVA